MKIAVVGNCQWVGITRCLRAVSGASDVDGFNGRLLETDPVEACNRVRSADFLFVQTGNADKLLAAADPDLAQRAIRFPRVTFGAFHPDLCAVLGPGGAILQTPMGDNSSRIAASAYNKGLSVRDTVALFNPKVFAALRYFDWWVGARSTLFADFKQSEVDTSGLFEKWVQTGCFMHTANHPKLHVVADVAVAMAKRINLTIRTFHPHVYLHDDLKDAPIWPVYPEIAERLRLEGDYCFKTWVKRGQEILSLEEFVEASFDSYKSVSKLAIPHLDIEEYGDRLIAAAESVSVVAQSVAVAPLPVASDRPYANSAPYQLWRSAVARPSPGDVDPVGSTRFKLLPHHRVASVGSCFAQHIARRLKSAGLNYLVTEPAPPGVSMEEEERRGFGLFTARYGNVYSARQLSQLMDRALGETRFEEPAWERLDGRLADPFRPSIEPDGFESAEAVRLSEKNHLAAVREMIGTMDVLVFTLGLTEAWRAKRSGAVFPSAPGILAGKWNAEEYEFVNFSAEEVVDDICAAFAKVRRVNPNVRFILTVSPVPLIATAEARHVLQATTYSKSVLRVAAEVVRQRFQDVDYFPSYEIVSSTFSRGAYFESDLRSVTPAGVDHVMRLFLHHLYGHDVAVDAPIQDYEVFCDEEWNA